MDDVALTPRAAERLQRAAHAAQELSGALWDALRDELSDPRPDRVAELTERLVAVAGAVSALARVEGDRAAVPPTAHTSPPGSPPPRAGVATRRPAQTAVLVDELEGDGEVEAYSARARWRVPARVEDLP